MNGSGSAFFNTAELLWRPQARSAELVGVSNYMLSDIFTNIRPLQNYLLIGCRTLQCAEKQDNNRHWRTLMCAAPMIFNFCSGLNIIMLYPKRKDYLQIVWQVPPLNSRVKVYPPPLHHVSMLMSANSTGRWLNVHTGKEPNGI